MKRLIIVALILLSVLSTTSKAQFPTGNQGEALDTKARGYWVDPSSGLMWAGKDNGKDLNWHNAMKYCRNLRLAGFSDWRLASIDELRRIWDKSAEAPGRDGTGPCTWHIKGNLFLTGMEWSST